MTWPLIRVLNIGVCLACNKVAKPYEKDRGSYGPARGLGLNIS
jgi:hypothetical protein